MDVFNGAASIADNLRKIRESKTNSLALEGKLTRVVGLTLEAVGCHEAIGTRVMISMDHALSVEAEVVGFDKDKSFI